MEIENIEREQLNESTGKRYPIGYAINNNLGLALNTKQVAKLSGLDEKTVRKYYRELGGILLGRRYLFFEKEFTYAIQKKRSVDCPSEERGLKKREDISDEEGLSSMGNENEKKVRRRLGQEDRHGLFGRLGKQVS